MPHKALIITSNQQLCQDIEDSLQGLSLEFHHADGYMQALSMVARYHYIRSHGDRLCPCFILQLMRMLLLHKSRKIAGEGEMPKAGRSLCLWY